jgi:hypothetical protein
MQYESVFISLAVILVGFLAFFGANGIVTSFNEEYNQTFLINDSGFAGVISRVNNNISPQFRSVGENLGGATEGEEGSGTTDENAGLIKSALRVISGVKDIMGLAPSAMKEGGRAIGIGEEYIDIGVTVFVFVFALMFGYLLLLGVRRIL